MAVREAINAKKGLGYAAAGSFLLIAIGIVIYSQLPDHKIKGDLAYFSDDDGQTWFLDGVHRVPPFDRNGKIVVRATIYSYAHGDKTYCAYLVRYIPSAKKRLDDAVADAAKHGKGPETVALFSDRELNTTGVEVKQPGPGHSWVVRGTIAGSDEMNAGIAAHADDSSDLVIPE